MIFPPVLVAQVRPAADRAALGPVLLWWLTRNGDGPALAEDHLVILNGRHRAMAAYLEGRTFPAYVWASYADLTGLPWSGTAAAHRMVEAEREVLRVAAERGRRGFPLPGAGGPVVSAGAVPGQLPGPLPVTSAMALLSA